MKFVSGDLKKKVRRSMKAVAKPVLVSELIEEYQPGYLEVATIGDVHLAHRRVKSTKIIKMLRGLFSPERMSQLDVLVINGDLFDRRIYFSSEDVTHITDYFKHLIALANEHSVRIILLEGTPSHDNNQPKRLMELNDVLRDTYKCDLVYYDDITIDELVPGGPIALFIPDEISTDSDTTWMKVNELMRMKGIDKVDFAFMHGMFTYQEVVRSKDSHLETNYRGIVRHLAIINHWHLHSANDFIRAPGSPERLRHGEEETKGHHHFSYCGRNGVVKEYFVMSEDTTIFETIDVVGKSYGDVVKELDSRGHYPEGSNVRLFHSRDDESYLLLQNLQRDYGHLNITDKVSDVITTKIEDSDISLKTNIVAIRPDTINELMVPRLQHLEPEVLELAMEILDGRS